MKRLNWVYVLTFIVLLVVGPVLVKQLWPAEGRRFERVSLEETTYAEVSFRNRRQQLQLGGLLFVPSGEGPFPAVVIIHGSGTSIRDNGWYLTLTHHLQQNGIAVLLPDKRGSEKSEGDWRSADFHDLATDTLAAIEFLGDQDLAEISSIGVVGMSQGGWIAPIAASESDTVAFVVSIAGSAVTPTEQLLYEENLNLRQLGFLPGVSWLIARMSTTYIMKVAQADFWNGIADYDPLPYWKSLSIDALVLLGRDDTNVPAEESATRLRELGNRGIRVEIYEGSGHALEDPVGHGNSIFRADALRDISEFIRGVTGQDS